jgi:adhesin transport system membrane fusion protein
MAETDFKKLARELSGRQSRSSSLLLFIIVLLVAALLFWAANTELDNVTRGTGKTISESQNQMVQSSEAGVLRARYVDDGDFVERGQTLFDIDPIDAKGQLEQAEKRQRSLQIQKTRLDAEITESQPEFSSELMLETPEEVANELALYTARRQDLQNGISILEQRKKQRESEIEESQITYQTAQNNLALIRYEIATVEPLVTSGLAPETRLTQLRRDEEENIGRAESAQASQRRLAAALEEIDQELKSARQSYVTRALTEKAQISATLSELESALPSLRDRVERNTVRSPVNGVINRINYRTEGAYVQPGDVLLEIVPVGEDLIVEARINPSDIPDIIVGHDVRISLSAYEAIKYGRMDGKVLNISADALSDPNTGEQYYQVDISILSKLYEDNGEEVLLLPGMVATIDVLSGKRTVLQYFWQPLARIKERAFVD